MSPNLFQYTYSTHGISYYYISGSLRLNYVGFLNDINKNYIIQLMYA